MEGEISEETTRGMEESAGEEGGKGGRERREGKEGGRGGREGKEIGNKGRSRVEERVEAPGRATPYLYKPAISSHVTHC